MNFMLRLCVFIGMVALGAVILVSMATPLSGNMPASDNGSLAVGVDADGDDSTAPGASESESGNVSNSVVVESEQDSNPVVEGEKPSPDASAGNEAENNRRAKTKAQSDGKEVKDPKDGKTFLEPEGKEVKEVLEPIGEGPIEEMDPELIVPSNGWSAPGTYTGLIRGLEPPGLPPVVDPPDFPDEDVISYR